MNGVVNRLLPFNVVNYFIKTVFISFEETVDKHKPLINGQVTAYILDLLPKMHVSQGWLFFLQQVIIQCAE
jgi:hypothetical protein